MQFCPLGQQPLEPEDLRGLTPLSTGISTLTARSISTFPNGWISNKLHSPKPALYRAFLGYFALCDSFAPHTPRKRRERSYEISPWMTYARFIIFHTLLWDETYAAPPEIG